MSAIISKKYLSVSRKEHRGKRGVLVKTGNPDGKVDTLPFEALKEIGTTLEVLRDDKELDFVVFYDNEMKVHAGADLAMFSGDIDSQLVREYLMTGARLDLLVKSLGKRTVSVIQGDCYGGSVEWPLMADYSVCAGDASIQFSEVNLGIIPGWSGILNVLLRSNKENALYLAATGCKIGAREMLSAGLVSWISSNDDMLACAMDLATASAIDKAPVKSLSTIDEINLIIKSRTDVDKYRNLSAEVLRKMDRGELSDDKHADNHVGKYISKRLNELGRPLALLAVGAVSIFVNKYSNIKSGDMGLIGEMACDEAELCFKLMETADRKMGINSILTSNPLDRIPVYAGK